MRPGSRIGAYVVVSELGRGGMGIVFRVRGSDGVERALKLLLRADARGREHFRRETRLLARFALEDGVVPLVDAGETADGPFVVMPLVPGGSLRERLAAGPLSFEETLAIGRSLAAALAKYPATKLVISVHIDNRNPEAKSLAITQEQADVAKAYLVANGVPAERITATGMGSADPAVSNSSSEGREKNRRVVLDLVNP